MTAFQPLFRSFLQAGFECSTQKHRTGRRLDLLESTKHDLFAFEDYKRIQSFQMMTARVAARWHRVEERPGVYDFASLNFLLCAAERSGTELAVDLLHFGWPDHYDIFSAEFPRAFGNFTRAFCSNVRKQGACIRFIAPVNEISFFSWAGGDVACINPFAEDRGHELKRILVRCAAIASDILLNELPGVRLISPEPVIHIVGNDDIPGDHIEAEAYRRAQFESWDMLSGRMWPELGGKPEYLDILGVNYYERNQWVHNSETALQRTDPRYRPFHLILQEVWDRYKRPMFIAETGTEDDVRAEWFTYICEQVIAAHHIGVPIHGLCLYPILNHPGWEDDRHCCNGLFDYADEYGNRDLHWPLAEAILKQQPRLQESVITLHDSTKHRSNLSFSPTLGVRFPAPAAFDEPYSA